MKKMFLTSACALLLSASVSYARPQHPFPHKKEIYKKGWIDFNKNGKKTSMKIRHRISRNESTTCFHK